MCTIPLMKCEKDGWKYGDSGKCYHGPDAKKKAVKQGLAENGGKWSDAFDNIVRACEHEERMDRIYGRARIRAAEDPSGELKWKILGTDFYFATFEDALTFKGLVDAGAPAKKTYAEKFKVPAKEFGPHKSAEHKKKMKEQQRKVNPALESTEVSPLPGGSPNAVQA